MNLKSRTVRAIGILTKIVEKESELDKKDSYIIAKQFFSGEKSLSKFAKSYNQVFETSLDFKSLSEAELSNKILQYEMHLQRLWS